MWGSRNRFAGRRTGVGWLGAGRVLAGLAGGFALMVVCLVSLGPVLLGPRGQSSGTDAGPRPELIPGSDAPGSQAFGGGAAAGPSTLPARVVEIVAPGVVVAALDHARAGVRRGDMVRVLPTSRVAARRGGVPVPGHPSLQLTTISRGAVRRAAGATVETTPPAIVCQTIDPGWHGDNIAIDCSADDTGSGLADPADAAFTLSTHVAAGAEDAQAATDSHTVCDVSGNCAVASAVALSVDRRPPTVSCAEADRSWQPVDQTVACTADDGGSGLASAAGRHVVLRTSVAAGSEDPAAATDSAKVCDAAGNCATVGPVTGLRIDRKPPRLHLDQQPNGGDGWFDQAPAELNAVGQDAQLAHVSCVADADTPARRTTTSAPKTATLQLTTDGAHDVTCTAVDLAGNTTSATATLQLDTTAPSLTLDTDQSTYGVDDTVTVACAASDPLSGVASRDCPARTAPASRFALGRNTLTASATDAAGNKATATASFNVTVEVAGLTRLTRRLVGDATAAAALAADLNAVGAAPDSATKAAAITTFENDVRALPAQAIANDDAATLIRFADAL